MTSLSEETLAKRKELEERHEPLRPELRQYIDHTAFGVTLRHPLITDTIDDWERCAAIHFRIDALTEMLRTAESAGDWEGAIFCHSHMYRVHALTKYARKLDDETYWHLLGELWVAQEFTSSLKATYTKLFRSKRPKRECLMSPAEREAFQLLPEEFTVFRGYAKGRGRGLSWTLDRRVACSFAHRESLLRQCPPKLLVGSIMKEQAWAFFHGENEILAPPGAVRVTHRQEAEPGTGGPCPSDFDLSTVLTGPLTLSFEDCGDNDEDQDDDQCQDTPA